MGAQDNITIKQYFYKTHHLHTTYVCSFVDILTKHGEKNTHWENWEKASSLRFSQHTTHIKRVLKELKFFNNYQVNETGG